MLFHRTAREPVIDKQRSIYLRCFSTFLGEIIVLTSCLTRLTIVEVNERFFHIETDLLNTVCQKIRDHSQHDDVREANLYNVFNFYSNEIST